MDLVDVRLGPLLDRGDDRQDGRSQRRELIIDPDGHGWRDGPGQQSIALESSQRLSEHLLADAGTVVAVGPRIERFTVGDAVIGMRNLLNARVGAQAEYVVLDESAVAQAPRTVTPAEAATIPLNGLTAAQALDLLALGDGEWLLVTGAAGALDAAVLSVEALNAVRDGGSFVAVAAGAAPPPLRGTRVHNVWIRTDPSQLAELSALVDAGKLTPRVAATQPLDTVASAHERLQARGLRGRIVLQPA
ncbi:MAG TPA: zinc-binding dehydrogenase [Solirubrobacteraceae bacterium]